ncbi:hypothetical protein OH456_12750 [Vibrio sp. La 4.2.2]|uniref:hypothetical protein n=1 Tax=Vibrio sp. La 4.2.2 TaxID=2998830 RepID=UPI0022CDD256|nr:hypothetical protein [Vibrio sp. La 4.2.2]MDA0109030.1 hypothetical protein [Vibrio sp. La 4.2.2]
MKNFLSAVYTEMSARLKTPLLGTFALCWLLYNHDHVAKLIFSDNAQRLVLVEETPFYWMSDLVIPVVLSLVYIFAIPFAQWLVDLAKYKLIEKRRVATQHSQLLEKYSGQMKVAQRQSKASLEYWQEYYRNNAENAGKQILELKQRISAERNVVNQMENKLREAERNYDNLFNNNQTLGYERDTLNKTIADIEGNKAQLVNRFNQGIQEAIALSYKNERVELDRSYFHRLKSEIIESISEQTDKYITSVGEETAEAENITRLASDIVKLVSKMIDAIEEQGSSETKLRKQLHLKLLTLAPKEVSTVELIETESVEDTLGVLEGATTSPS